MTAAATLRRIADDPHNSITSADKMLIEEAARELDRLTESRVIDSSTNPKWREVMSAEEGE